MQILCVDLLHVASIFSQLPIHFAKCFNWIGEKRAVSQTTIHLLLRYWCQTNADRHIFNFEHIETARCFGRKRTEKYAKNRCHLNVLYRFLCTTFFLRKNEKILRLCEFVCARDDFDTYVNDFVVEDAKGKETEL